VSRILLLILIKNVCLVSFRVRIENNQSLQREAEVCVLPMIEVDIVRTPGQIQSLTNR
jgi:hypothetical protein